MIPASIYYRNITRREKKQLPSYKTEVIHYFSSVYVAAIKNNSALTISGTTLGWSEDEGYTNTRTISFADAGKINFAYIFSNDTVLFATHNKIYRSTDKLVSFSEINVIDTNGSNYIPHTPVSATYPGSYFRPLSIVNKSIVNNKEMIVWGNYTAYLYGPSPVNVYYSLNGESVKIAYKFGQNPYHRDNGSAIGGTSGNLLGDSTNNVFARHVHSAAYDKWTQKWYFCTGDAARTEGYECHWFSGTYNATNDTWNWDKLISVGANSRFKSAGISFDKDYIYFGSDQNQVLTGGTENGVWKCTRGGLLDTSSHILLLDLNDPIRTLIECHLDESTNTLILLHYYNDDNRIHFLRKDGFEHVFYDFATENEFCMMQKKNTSGYYKVHTRYMYSAGGQPNSLFIKI